jgi:hypothetical protein
VVSGGVQPVIGDGGGEAQWKTLTADGKTIICSRKKSGTKRGRGPRYRKGDWQEDSRCMSELSAVSWFVEG